jgi:hypothetical protein
MKVESRTLRTVCTGGPRELVIGRIIARRGAEIHHPLARPPAR